MKKGGYTTVQPLRFHKQPRVEDKSNTIKLSIKFLRLSFWDWEKSYRSSICLCGPKSFRSIFISSIKSFGHLFINQDIFNRLWQAALLSLFQTVFWIYWLLILLLPSWLAPGFEIGPSHHHHILDFLECILLHSAPYSPKPQSFF